MYLIYASIVVKQTLDIFLFIYIYVCLYTCTHSPSMIQMRTSEDNFGGLFIFYHVSPRNRVQVSMFDSKDFNPLSHPTGP